MKTRIKTSRSVFLFATSTLARYRVNEWAMILAGRDNDMRIQRYMQAIQLFFPNLILNILYGKRLVFLPFAFETRSKG